MPEFGGDLIVIGSVNVDHVVVAEAFPHPGETVRGTKVHVETGGKGANQAVAAALAGARVRMIAQVGADSEGERARADLSARGVDVRDVGTATTEPTGTAWITVAEQDNTIVIVAGANGSWPTVLPELNGSVLLAQLEVPLDVVLSAATGFTGVFVLNAAPAADLPDALLARCDVLVVNEHELAIVARTVAGDHDLDLERAHTALLERGVSAVVTTLGQSGAVVTDATGSTRLPALPAPTVVDTTGAGDAFTGVLAARLSMGDGLADAVRWATVAGSHAVRSAGAQPSYLPFVDLQHEVAALQTEKI